MSSTAKMATGIDTRGGRERHKGTSHVVAWPSKIAEGGSYKWIQGGPVGFVPETLVALYFQKWESDRPAKLANGIQGLEEVKDDDVDPIVPLDQVARMVDHVDPDDMTYDEWLQIGMAIKTQHPGPDGLKVWDDWSRTGDRYKVNECSLRWDGMDPMGKVRIGTLFFYAKKYGWVQDPIEVEQGPMDAIVSEMNTRVHLVMVGKNMRYLLPQPKDLWHCTLPRYNLLGFQDVTGYFSNETAFVPSANGRGMQKVNKFELWRASKKRREYMNGLGMYPPGIDLPKGRYNTWQGFAAEPVPGHSYLIHQHIKEVICDGNEKHYQYLLDWCADLFQNPGRVSGTAVVMKGPEGAGKGVFADKLLGEIIGYHFVHITNQHYLTGNFNSLLADRILGFADEVTWGGDRKHAGILKAMVTERTMVIERKGVDAITVPNCMRLVVASNEEWVIPAGSESRRWFVLQVSGTHKNDRSYFGPLMEEIENGGREAFLYEMLNRKITHNVAFALETEALKEQRAATMTSTDTVAAWWKWCLERGKIPLSNPFDPNEVWPSMAIPSNMYDSYTDWCLNLRKNPVSSMLFYKAMVNWGCRNHRSTKVNGGSRVYQIPGIRVAIKIFLDKTNIWVLPPYFEEGEHDEFDE